MGQFLVYLKSHSHTSMKEGLHHSKMGSRETSWKPVVLFQKGTKGLDQGQSGGNDKKEKYLRHTGIHDTLEVHSGAGGSKDDVVIRFSGEQRNNCTHLFGIPVYALNARQPLGRPRRGWLPGVCPLAKVSLLPRGSSPILLPLIIPATGHICKERHNHFLLILFHNKMPS